MRRISGVGFAAIAVASFIFATQSRADTIGYSTSTSLSLATSAAPFTDDHDITNRTTSGTTFASDSASLSSTGDPSSVKSSASATVNASIGHVDGSVSSSFTSNAFGEVSDATAKFTDTLYTVADPTSSLKAGDVITLEAILGFQATCAGSGELSYAFNAGGASWTGSMGGSFFPGQCGGHFAPQTFQVKLGDDFSASGRITLQVGTPGEYPDSFAKATDPDLYLTAITPGVEVKSFSGHNYAPTVPEPASLLLLASGLAGLLYRRRVQ